MLNKPRTCFRLYSSIAAVSALLFLQACAGTGVGSTTIDSNPPGATILANGKTIGETPKQINNDEVFPPRWFGTSYMVKGKLTLQKEGCKIYEMDVSDQALMNDIKATLECDPAITQTPTIQTPKSQPQTSATTQTEMVDSTTEQRLVELKKLYDKGLISDQEYNAQRTRILNSL